MLSRTHVALVLMWKLVGSVGSQGAETRIGRIGAGLQRVQVGLVGADAGENVAAACDSRRRLSSPHRGGCQTRRKAAVARYSPSTPTAITWTGQVARTWSRHRRPPARTAVARTSAVTMSDPATVT
jgi:hypothetical protein